MAKVEIEESALAELTAVNNFVSGALKNPKTRRTLLGVQKALNPDASIPELDATDHVMSAVGEIKTMVEGVKADLEKRTSDDAEARRVASLQDRVSKGQDYLRAHGYQDDGIKKVEELMLAENIASYAAGLALFEKINPPQAPADETRIGRFGSMSDADVEGDFFKKLMETQGRDDHVVNSMVADTRKAFRGH